MVGYDPILKSFEVREVWGKRVRVDDKVLSCVVFLGLDQYGPFAPIGTAFLGVNTTEGHLFQQIITARHVIEDVDKRISQICVRMNRRDGQVEQTYTERKDWVFHPDPAVDLAICPSHIPAEQYNIVQVHLERELATNEIINTHEIGIGDDVFMAGMFTRHIGEVQNRPVTRTGTIALMQHEKILTNRGLAHGYLVEARSIAGLSGSPVFVHMAPLRVVAGGVVRMAEGYTHYFLGVMQGHFLIQDLHEVVSPDKPSPGELATGLGFVVPGEKILEIINLPHLREHREAIVEDLKCKSGFASDSVRSG